MTTDDDQNNVQGKAPEGLENAPGRAANMGAPPRLVAENQGLRAEKIGKQFRKRPVVRDVSLVVKRGEAVGLLGPNGAGKTTCFYMITGLLAPDTGSIFIDGQDVTDWPMYRRARLGVGYLPQEPELNGDKDVAGNVLEGMVETKALLDRFEEVNTRFAGELDEEEMSILIEEQAELQEKIDAADAWDLSRTVDIAMDALRCPLGDAEVTVLSGGEKRRVSVGVETLGGRTLLLADSPTDAAAAALASFELTARAKPVAAAAARPADAAAPGEDALQSALLRRARARVD